MGHLTDGLTFNTLRRANVQRLPLFKNSKGEVSHSEPDGSDWSPAQWLQAVVGEIGEYANFRKKFERGDISYETFRTHAKKEIADVVIYLDILAYRLGIDLGKAVMDKFNEVSNRVGANVYIDAEDWHRRQNEMPAERYQMLMNDEEAKLTPAEISNGWHFCLDWDGLLIGPGMTEIESCTCVSATRR